MIPGFAQGKGRSVLEDCGPIHPPPRTAPVKGGEKSRHAVEGGMRQRIPPDSPRKTGKDREGKNLPGVGAHASSGKGPGRENSCMSMGYRRRKKAGGPGQAGVRRGPSTGPGPIRGNPRLQASRPGPFRGRSPGRTCSGHENPRCDPREIPAGGFFQEEFPFPGPGVPGFEPPG